MDYEQLRGQLEQLKAVRRQREGGQRGRTERSHRPTDQRLQPLFHALQRILVDLPQGGTLSAENLALLSGLLGLKRLERHGDNDEKRAATLPYLASWHLQGKRREDWDNWLRNATVEERFGNDPTKYRAVYEFVDLVLQFLDSPASNDPEPGFLDDASPSKQMNGAASSDRPSVTISVRLVFDSVTAATDYDISLEGEFDAWYLGILKAKVGGQEPVSNVLIDADEVTYGRILDPKPSEFDALGATIYFETCVGRQYLMPAEALIIETCRLAVQYFPEYFQSAESLIGLVRAVLSQSWRCLDDDAETFFVVYTRVVYKEIALSKRAVGDILKRNRKYPADRSDLIGLVDEGIRLAQLPRELLLEVGIPTVIARWLEDVNTDPADRLGDEEWQHPDRFFSTLTWHLVHD